LCNGLFAMLGRTLRGDKIINKISNVRFAKASLGPAGPWRVPPDDAHFVT